ncbi:MAG: hypothetical protein ACK4VN_07595 [Bacteroidales bacterium]
MKTLKILPLLFSVAFLWGCQTPNESYFHGKWEAVEYFVNAEDQLAINKIFLTFTSEGGFEQTVMTHDQARHDEGTWVFNNSDKTFRMTYQRNGQVVTWKVLDQSRDHFHMNNEEYSGFYVEWKFKRID